MDTPSTCDIKQKSAGESLITLSGELSEKSVPLLWKEIARHLVNHSPSLVTVDASSVTFCDTVGVSLLLSIVQYQKDHGQSADIKNLSEKIEKLFALFVRDGISPHVTEPHKKESIIIALGKNVSQFWDDLARQISFSGELALKFSLALMNPKEFRWKDVWSYVYAGGLEALPIVLSLSFLMGLIMAFQAAIPMRQFGADVFVADLVSLSMLRELGPLMTAVILAGRTGSSFAAEIGTMKVSEELDALRTMGLNPVSFLIINRVLAVLIFTPILTVFADFAGLIGGGVVFRSLGYPLITYFNQITAAVSLNDFLGGFVKSFVFGLLIASIGCLRGLETKSGARSVGLSATRAVVSGLTLIVVVDGIFAIIYYYLGI